MTKCIVLYVTHPCISVTALYPDTYDGYNYARQYMRYHVIQCLTVTTPNIHDIRTIALRHVKLPIIMTSDFEFRVESGDVIVSFTDLCNMYKDVMEAYEKVKDK